jgi:hypothetical protein
MSSPLIPYCFFDSPQVIDCSVTPIPASGSLPLQVIATTGGLNLGCGIQFADTTGDMIGVYIGASGSEVLACIIGNGVSSQGWAKFPPNSRISLRNMLNTEITLGRLYGVLVMPL